MNIKNIYTNAKEEVIDSLLRYLSQHNISYVRVEDEVHFLDKIYRFYNSKDNSLEDTLKKIYKTLNELEVSKRLSIDDNLIECTIAEGRVDTKYPIPDYNKKKLIKMQNRRNSLKIKNSNTRSSVIYKITLLLLKPHYHICYPSSLRFYYLFLLL